MLPKSVHPPPLLFYSTTACVPHADSCHGLCPQLQGQSNFHPVHGDGLSMDQLDQLMRS